MCGVILAELIITVVVVWATYTYLGRDRVKEPCERCDHLDDPANVFAYLYRDARRDTKVKAWGGFWRCPDCGELHHHKKQTRTRLDHEYDSWLIRHSDEKRYMLRVIILWLYRQERTVPDLWLRIAWPTLLNTHGFHVMDAMRDADE